MFESIVNVVRFGFAFAQSQHNCNSIENEKEEEDWFGNNAFGMRDRAHPYDVSIVLRIAWMNFMSGAQCKRLTGDCKQFNQGNATRIDSTNRGHPWPSSAGIASIVYWQHANDNWHWHCYLMASHLMSHHAGPVSQRFSELRNFDWKSQTNAIDWNDSLLISDDWRWLTRQRDRSSE